MIGLMSYIVKCPCASEYWQKSLSAQTMMNTQSNLPIDRNSFVPLYVQVKEHLQHQIEQGVWQPGEQIPSETELCNTYDISRTVIRRALLELQHEGLIFSQKGEGQFCIRAQGPRNLGAEPDRLLPRYEGAGTRGLQSHIASGVE